MIYSITALQAVDAWVRRLAPRLIIVSQFFMELFSRADPRKLDFDVFINSQASETDHALCQESRIETSSPISSMKISPPVLKVAA